eukprot:TRINITY_DN9132_c0_g1_i1.p1 TRINITY_DN9132_c0_g1~~TRINITY_DN9132_c0_g1_i1.p1  ORF type:complete len:201 (-),score=80.93 TRINITY_DN9132_c0_g1_i1:74-676(-)
MATSYHFSPAEAPDEQMFTDLQKLNAFEEELLMDFVDVVFSFLAGKASLADGVSAFAESNGVNEAKLKGTVKALLHFLRGGIRNNCTPKHLAEDLIALGLSKEKAIVIVRAWKAESASLSKSTIQQTLTVNEVIDMEWRFGVTAANEELNSVGSAYLQLRLVLDKGNGTETVHMELTLPQFYKFLNEMEKAKAQMGYFGQ